MFVRQARPIDSAPPVRLIHRRHGLPVAHAEWWQGVFPGAEMVTIEGADRLLQGLDAGLIAEEAVAVITGRETIGSTGRAVVAVFFTDLVDCVDQTTSTEQRHNLDDSSNMCRSGRRGTRTPDIFLVREAL